LVKKVKMMILLGKTDVISLLLIAPCLLATEIWTPASSLRLRAAALASDRSASAIYLTFETPKISSRARRTSSSSRTCPNRLHEGTFRVLSHRDRQ
jgi:hypothetical protein